VRVWNPCVWFGESNTSDLRYPLNVSRGAGMVVSVRDNRWEIMSLVLRFALGEYFVGHAYAVLCV